MTALFVMLRSRLLVAAWLLPPCALLVLLGLEKFAPPHSLSIFEAYGPWVLGGAFLVSAALLLRHFLLRRKNLESIMDTVEAVGHGHYADHEDLAAGGDLGELSRSIEWMAERVRTHLAEVMEEKQKLSAVLNGIWEGVLVLGCDGRIQAVNRAMEGVVPGIAERIGARPLEVMASPELQDGCDKLLRGREEGKENMRITLGEDRCYNVNLIRPVEASGLGLIAVFHDISEMERLRSMRSDFAANVSHELRTPLTSIKGYAETLLSDTPPPPDMSRRFMAVILRNANHMGKMISDLLTLSRIESGGGGAKVEPTDGRAALASAWEAVEAMARKREVSLERFLPGDLPFVLAEQDRLTQVFRNLLENAIKFGPEGTSVEAGAHLDGNTVRFTVRDYGPGIPKAHQDRVFERFYSVEKHRRNEFGSTGLGLSICRHIVRELGGEIGMESPPAGSDTGTLFHFTVPAASPERNAAAPAARVSTLGQGRGRRPRA